MTFGVIALMVATRPRPAQRSGAPRPGPWVDRGGLRLSVAKELLLGGDQAPREQRHDSALCQPINTAESSTAGRTVRERRGLTGREPGRTTAATPA
jgi:hypothetical protein